MRQRRQDVIDELVASAGVNPTEDLHRRAYITAINDFLEIQFEETNPDD